MGLRADHHADVRVSPTCSSAGSAHDARAAAIRFVEPGTGEVVALRPDITPQIARVVATRLAEVEGPIRLCYEGAVIARGLRAASSGQREILQAGIELIEAGEPAGDAEVLAVAAAALAAAQLPETRIDVGHVAPARVRARGCARSRRRARRLAGGARAQGSRGPACGGARAARRRRAARRGARRRCGARRRRRSRAPGRCRGRAEVAAALDELRRGARRVRRARRSARAARSRSISAICAASTTTPACGSRATRAARPRRCCAAAATTS